jgi:hypothetical protein
MSTTASLWTETGLEVLNLQSDAAFCARRLSTHDTVARMEAMQRLASAFVHHPDRMLQELADAAVELCGADSAGISVERPEGSDQEFYHWVATAGQYNGCLPAASAWNVLNHSIFASGIASSTSWASPLHLSPMGFFCRGR